MRGVVLSVVIGVMMMTKTKKIEDLVLSHSRNGIAWCTRLILASPAYEKSSRAWRSYLKTLTISFLDFVFSVIHMRVFERRQREYFCWSRRRNDTQPKPTLP